MTLSYIALIATLAVFIALAVDCLMFHRKLRSNLNDKTPRTRSKLFPMGYSGGSSSMERERDQRARRTLQRNALIAKKWRG